METINITVSRKKASNQSLASRFALRPTHRPIDRFLMYASGACGADMACFCDLKIGHAQESKGHRVGIFFVLDVRRRLRRGPPLETLIP